MIEFTGAIQRDLEKYKRLGGRIEYPFPIEDFALRVFGLDVQYEDFDVLLSKEGYEPGEFFGMLLPEYDPITGFEKVIYVNTNRKPFKVGDYVVPKEYYIDNADRQTIAHETGHFSDRYVHNNDGQPSMFPEMFADDPASILVYPKDEEVFANKYARHLLVPDGELIRLIHENNLHGTIDLRETIDIFTSKFGVTQFMIEIRMNELKVHFTNGVYIRKLNYTRGKDYSEKELLVLLEIAKKYGFGINYYDADAVVGLFNKTTGETRASGPLYMAFRRLMLGEYDSRFPRVFEKRLELLLGSESDNKTNDNVITFPAGG